MNECILASMLILIIAASFIARAIFRKHENSNAEYMENVYILHQETKNTMDEYLNNEVQKCADKYHCHVERYEDAAENDVLVFYAGTYVQRYLICRICLDEYDLDDKSSIDAFMSIARRELDECRISLIDKANNGQTI